MSISLVPFNRRLLVILLYLVIALSTYQLWHVYNYHDVDSVSFFFHGPKYIQENIANLRNGGSVPGNESRNGGYESIEVWRVPDSFAPTYQTNTKLKRPAIKFENVNGRPKYPHPSSFPSTGHYLQMPLVADYHPNADKVFLMIKTGASVLWERLPIHLFTTLTRVPNFALYSDAPGSIGGYEVIDILANLTSKTRKHADFQMYRDQRTLYDMRGNIALTDVEGKDGWNLDKFKNIPMLAHAWTVSPESDWFIFMDADSYLFLDGLFDYLSGLDPNEPLYLGGQAGLTNLKFAHGGSGVVLSRRTMKDTVGTNPQQVVKDYEERTFKECCGDFMVSNMVIDLTTIRLTKNLGFNREQYYLSDLDASKWCDPVYSFHHLNPHDIEVLWEYERIKKLEGKPILYADIYRDLILPYIDNRIENWDNEADSDNISLDKDKKKDKKPSTDGGPEVRPYESVEACEKYCKSIDQCLSYRYHKKKNECRIGKYIRFGKPALDFQKSTRRYNNQGMISGWMIDRIQEMRNKTGCDTVLRKPDSTHAEKDRSEGWMRRIDPNVIKGIYR